MSFSVFWKEEKIYLNVEFEDDVKRAFFSDKPFFDFEDCQLSRRIERYFEGEIVTFKVKLKADLSPFTRKVLEEVSKIPYGDTRTYGEIAEKLHTSPRAVGQALKRNPAVVIIPCHRVVAIDGLGGFSQGLNIKIALLRLEKVL